MSSQADASSGASALAGDAIKYDALSKKRFLAAVVSFFSSESADGDDASKSACKQIAGVIKKYASLTDEHVEMLTPQASAVEVFVSSPLSMPKGPCKLPSIDMESKPLPRSVFTSETEGDTSTATSDAAAGDGGEKLSKKQLKKMKKKDEKKQHAADDQQRATEDQLASVSLDDDFARDQYGKILPDGFSSQSESPVDLKTFSKILITQPPQLIWVYVRLQEVRSIGKLCFLVLRQQFWTAQACVRIDGENVSKQMVEFCKKSIPRESMVWIRGTLAEVPTPLVSCSQNDVELTVTRIYVASESNAVLPFSLEDAMRTEVEDDSETTVAGEKPVPTDDVGKAVRKPAIRVGQDTRLDNRVFELRIRSNQAIFRIQAGICRFFRKFLDEQCFLEIHTPKMLSGKIRNEQINAC